MDRLKVYFVSDAHFGADSVMTSSERESLFIRWLDEIKNDATELYLLGDIFDFWFEYKCVVPRGFVLVLAKLNELAQNGVKIKFFTGNHDMWIFDYIPQIINAELIRKPEIINIGKHKFFIAHGDGLCKSERGYNLMKSMFSNRFFQFLFKSIHPDIGCRIALWCSKTSRNSHRKNHNMNCKNFNPENELLVQFAKQKLKSDHYDFFVFGHRHVVYQYKLANNSLFTSIGDWLNNFSYAVYDGQSLQLQKYINAK